MTTAANDGPVPPYLLVAVGRAFDVERNSVGAMRATRQAIAEGALRNAYLYDRNGSYWPIERAEIDTTRSTGSWHVPWTRLPLTVALASPAARIVSGVVGDVVEILETGNAFCEHLSETGPLDELVRRFSRCTTPEEVIETAQHALTRR